MMHIHIHWKLKPASQQIPEEAEESHPYQYQITSSFLGHTQEACWTELKTNNCQLSCTAHNTVSVLQKCGMYTSPASRPRLRRKARLNSRNLQETLEVTLLIKQNPPVPRIAAASLPHSHREEKPTRWRVEGVGWRSREGVVVAATWSAPSQLPVAHLGSHEGNMEGQGHHNHHIALTA